MQSAKEGEQAVVTTRTVPDVAVDKEWTMVDRIYTQAKVEYKRSKVKNGKCDAAISMISCSKEL